MAHDQDPIEEDAPSIIPLHSQPLKERHIEEARRRLCLATGPWQRQPYADRRISPPALSDDSPPGLDGSRWWRRIRSGSDVRWGAQ
jgi:hypothetical protein